MRAHGGPCDRVGFLREVRLARAWAVNVRAKGKVGVW